MQSTDWGEAAKPKGMPFYLERIPDTISGIEAPRVASMRATRTLCRINA